MTLAKALRHKFSSIPEPLTDEIRDLYGTIKYVVTYDKIITNEDEILMLLSGCKEMMLPGCTVYRIARVVELKTPVVPDIVGSGITFHTIDSASEDIITRKLCTPFEHIVLFDRL